MGDDELRSAAGGLGVARLVERSATESEGGDHEAVPGGEDLVVQMRAGAGGTALEEPGFNFGKGGADLVDGDSEVLRGLLDGVSLVEDVLAGEFAVRVVVDVAVG